MPLRCLDPESDASLFAFDLCKEAWAALEAENRRRRHLRMPCCSAEVTLRRSKLGTRFFAHKVVGACATAPESEAHLRLKQLAVEVARAAGWDAQTEVTGQTPEGEPWRADVLAWRGDKRIAIEIQWSPQTDEETFRRQARYHASGVRALWLFRQASFPVDERLPAARVEGSPEEGFTASLPYSSWRGGQPLPMATFLEAAFSKRLRFGLPLGIEARVQVETGRMFCWSCGAETPILTGVAVEAGPHEAHLTVPSLEHHPQLWNAVRSWVPDSPAVKAIKRRYSRTQERRYLSNGCSHCDALIGQFYENDAWRDEEVIYETVMPLDEHWREAIQIHGETERWCLF